MTSTSKDSLSEQIDLSARIAANMIGFAALTVEGSGWVRLDVRLSAA